MPETKVKAQHTVQCAYLAGFYDAALGVRKPRLRVYSPNQPVRTQVPRECAVVNYFYCFDQDGKRSFLVENQIAEMENASAPILDGLRRGRLPKPGTDSLTLAGYVALSAVRTPTAKRIVDQAYIDHQIERFRFLIDTPGELEAYLEAEEKRTGLKRDAADERRKLKGGQIRVTQSNHAWSLRMMFEQLTTFQHRVMRLHWMLLRSESGFLTCDHPVTFLTPRAERVRLRPGKVDPDVLFPVSRDYCFIGSLTPTPRYGELDESQTKLFNLATIRRADRFVYSPFDVSYVQEELDKAHQGKLDTMKSDAIQL